MSREIQHVAVIGAGIVGLSTAIWLQRAGFRVTLIDRAGPAAGASYGNAGVLAASGIVPVPVPGLIWKAPFMLFDRDAPLFLRWRYLPKLLPFLPRFLGSAKRVEPIADALSLLLHDSAEQHAMLAAGTPAARFVVQGDYLYGYADRAAFEADAESWAMRKARGHAFEPMDGDRLAQYDPALSGLFGYGVRCPNHGHITDPGAYAEALCTHFEAEGGTLLLAEAQDVLKSGDRVTGIATSRGPVEADHVVIACGAWSGGLARRLGCAVPMEAERGYHIEFVEPSIMPKAPVMVAAGKFVMTPMEGRLRCAGIVEFGGLGETRSRAPLDLLKRQTLALLPQLRYARIEEWMGHRPSTSDSLPLIGPLASAPNVWAAFGHQHVGLTAGPKTGRWLAQMIAGKAPNADLAPFHPARFEAGSKQKRTPQS